MHGKGLMMIVHNLFNLQLEHTANIKLKIVVGKVSITYKQLFAWEKKVCDILMQESVYSEGTVAKCCVESIGEGGELFIGNSMPIRDVDMFSLTSSKKIHTPLKILMPFLTNSFS